MNYQDQWTRWHHKPSNGVDPSSNNGWIYSAYAKYIKPETLDKTLLADCYNRCITRQIPLMVNRSPGQLTPPFSKDEVIGCVSLGLMDNKNLEKSHYNFCNISDQFDRKLSFLSIIKGLKTLYRIRNEHRNYVWKNNLTEAYGLAFKLPPEDIYYVKKMAKKSAGIFYTIIFFLSSLITIKKGDKSSRMMLWLKVKDLKLEDGYIGKKVISQEKQWLEDYFHENHPFLKK